MTFPQLVIHIVQITGLHPIEATRLLAVIIHKLTDDLDLATLGRDIPLDLAEHLIEAARLSVAQVLDLLV